jgi:hypothetical protein
MVANHNYAELKLLVRRAISKISPTNRKTPASSSPSTQTVATTKYLYEKAIR